MKISPNVTKYAIHGDTTRPNQETETLYENDKKNEKRTNQFLILNGQISI